MYVRQSRIERNKKKQRKGTYQERERNEWSEEGKMTQMEMGVEVENQQRGEGGIQLFHTIQILETRVTTKRRVFGKL